MESVGYHVVGAHPLKTRMVADANVKTDKHNAKTLGRGSQTAIF